MKRILTLILVLFLTSCNDGDFDVPAFEFTENVSSCNEYLLYISNSNNMEVLILPLTSTQLGTTTGEKSYTIPGTVSVIYRIFEEEFGVDYFCQSIPPSIPKVLKELIAAGGTLNINTLEKETDGIVTSYEYVITISDLLFDDGKERIFFENFDYGTFTLTN